MDKCKICGNEADNRRHVAREMMFGLRDQFSYLECSKCGCLQLIDVPADLSKYYPEGYYSLHKNNWLKVFLRHQWASYAYNGWNPLGWLVTKRFFRYGELYAIRRAQIAKSARILDVGGGTGQLILDMRHLGFLHLTGADPFITGDIAYPNGVRVFKRSVAELEGEFDVIMLHHSFEHMNAPDEVMRHLSRLIAPGGLILIRIPIAGSDAWRRYGVNWVHLDAPRHLFIHTPKTIEFLASRAGLTLDDVIYEGDESQFWGSEQYLKDIPLLDARSYVKNRSALTNEKIREYSAKAAENNRKKVADLACFHLHKSARKAT